MSEKWDEKVIELAKSLINCQSYSGHEDKAAEALKAYMKEAGVFDEIETDCYGNVIGHIKGKNPGSKVLFDGHIDTVPVGNLKDWKHDPFHAVVEDGKLYGRALIHQAYDISDIHKKYMQKCKISGNYSISALQALQFGV